MSRFFPALFQNIFVFPRKFLESPDSQQNLQIPRRICFSPETVLLRVVTPRTHVQSFHVAAYFAHASHPTFSVQREGFL